MNTITSHPGGRFNRDSPSNPFREVWHYFWHPFVERDTARQQHPLLSGQARAGALPEISRELVYEAVDESVRNYATAIEKHVETNFSKWLADFFLIEVRAALGLPCTQCPRACIP